MLGVSVEHSSRGVQHSVRRISQPKGQVLRNKVRHAKTYVMWFRFMVMYSSVVPPNLRVESRHRVRIPRKFWLTTSRAGSAEQMGITKSPAKHIHNNMEQSTSAVVYT